MEAPLDLLRPRGFPFGATLFTEPYVPSTHTHHPSFDTHVPRTFASTAVVPSIAVGALAAIAARERSTTLLEEETTSSGSNVSGRSPGLYLLSSSIRAATVAGIGLVSCVGHAASCSALTIVVAAV